MFHELRNASAECGALGGLGSVNICLVCSRRLSEVMAYRINQVVFCVSLSVFILLVPFYMHLACTPTSISGAAISHLNMFTYENSQVAEFATIL